MTRTTAADSAALLSATSATQTAESTERMWISALGALVVIQLWFGMIGTSFWLDETGTWWIVKDGLSQAIERAFSWSGQSPLFYLIAWLSSRVFGLNEIGLRIPSLLALAAAIYFVYRIAQHLYDAASAAIVAFVFLCTASFFAVDARPYAMALLFLAASTLALLRWLDSNRARDAALYVIAGVLTVYSHCILSLGLAAGMVYGFVCLKNDRPRLARLSFMELAIPALCLPLAPELIRFYTTRSVHTFTAQPSATDLMMALIPCSLAGALVLIVWISMALRGDTESGQKFTPRKMLLTGSWALFAPLFLALLSAGTDIHLFVSRYYSSALPGQALVIGGLLATIRQQGVRKLLLIAVAAIPIFGQGKLAVRSHGNEDWKAAMEFVRHEAGTQAPVLLVSGFAEAGNFPDLRKPALRDILFAPELIYGEPARSIRLPRAFGARDTADMEGVVRQIEKEPRFYLLTENPDRGYENWLAGRLAARCGSGPMEQSFGYIWVTRFICEKK